MQGALAAIDDGLIDQLLFGGDRRVIGLARGVEHHDGNPHDRQDKTNADRDDQAEPRRIPPRPFAFPGDWRWRRRHLSTLLTACLGGTIGSKYFE